MSWASSFRPGFDGFYTNKAGGSREGSATFFRRARFTALFHRSLSLKELFAQLWQARGQASPHAQLLPFLQSSATLRRHLQKVRSSSLVLGSVTDARRWPAHACRDCFPRQGGSSGWSGKYYLVSEGNKMACFWSARVSGQGEELGVELDFSGLESRCVIMGSRVSVFLVIFSVQLYMFQEGSASFPLASASSSFSWRILGWRLRLLAEKQCRVSHKEVPWVSKWQA